MTESRIPTTDEMYRAFMARDAAYEGIFVTAVRTTGIFCRPTCTARKPRRENIEFYRTPREAIVRGYRPCKRCRPLQPAGTPPHVIQKLLDALDRQPSERIRDRDLTARGVDPVQVRRWFKQHYGMTFQAYQRAQRLGQALDRLGEGESVTHVAFDNGYDSLSGFNEAVRQLTGRAPTDNRDARVVHLTRVLTPLGPMVAGTTAEGVCLLEFTDRRMLPTQLRRLEDRLSCTFVPGPTPLSERLAEEVAVYFDGSLREFSVPLLLAGTPFQEQVWEALRTIPYGETRSYGEQARLLGSPGAVRAVARANGDNRIAIIIPCHRVVGSDGSLTGYGGGLWRKRYLLDLERASGFDGEPAPEYVQGTFAW